jgi:hypothetical protein
MNDNMLYADVGQWPSSRTHPRVWIAIACVIAAILCAVAGEMALSSSGDLGPDQNLKRTDSIRLY